MAAAEEQSHMLQDAPEPSSQAEVSQLRARVGRHVWFGSTVAVVLALCGIVGVLAHHRGFARRQVLSHDVSTKRAFLNEIAVEYLEDRKAKEGRGQDAQKHTSTSHDGGEQENAPVNSLKVAEEKIGKAKSLYDHAGGLTKDAKKLQGKSDDLKKAAGDIKKHAGEEVGDAKKDRQDAEELRKKAEDMRKEAQKLMGKAAALDKAASKERVAATNKEAQAAKLADRASSTEEKATAEMQRAVDTETEGLAAVATQRVCIRLPGVKLKGANLKTFNDLKGKHEIKDEWQCTDWCQKHVECKQAVYTWETKTCQLFREATAEPEAFKDTWPFFNSTYCDDLGRKKDMLDMLHKVYNAKPWVPSPRNCSWAGENCMETKCCADVCMASWDFKTCKDYVCYKRDENFAGCKADGPPAGWDGYKLGGHPNGEVAPAPKGKLIQGTRLYCFSVVMWNLPPSEGWMSSEGELANHWKEQKKNIMQCDDYSFFDGLDGGSVHNIQSFIQAWKNVKDDGRWKRNDWVIKVDPDAVFFPDHLRQKIRWNYRTPQGSTVYLRNTFYKFKFLGALEAMTKEAMQLYFEKGWQCEAHLGQQGGEDYWLEQCLEGLGIDFQTDVTLLHDKYAADEACDDPNGVAHHFFKKIDGGDGWDNCWNRANKAWNDAHPPQ